MKDILKVTVEYFYDNDLDLEVRTASLYTLYAIYFHQMNRPRMKIAVTPDQWLSGFVDLDLRFNFKKYNYTSYSFDFE